MANIMQAAKWMQEGKRVRRGFHANTISLAPLKVAFCPAWIRVFENGRPAKGQRLAPFDPEDLLADDWEIAQEASHD